MKASSCEAAACEGAKEFAHQQGRSEADTFTPHMWRIAGKIPSDKRGSVHDAVKYVAWHSLPKQREAEPVEIADSDAGWGTWLTETARHAICT